MGDARITAFPVLPLSHRTQVSGFFPASDKRQPPRKTRNNGETHGFSPQAATNTRHELENNRAFCLAQSKTSSAVPLPNSRRQPKAPYAALPWKKKRKDGNANRLARARSEIQRPAKRSPSPYSNPLSRVNLRLRVCTVRALQCRGRPRRLINYSPSR